MSACDVSGVLSVIAIAVCGIAAVDTIRRVRWTTRSSAAAERVYALQRAKDDVIGDALRAWERGDKRAVAAGLAALDAGRGEWVAAMTDWTRVNADAPRTWPR